jgi:transposase InsO family protein
MLRLEGWRVNVKRVHRLWKQEGYRVPRCRKKRVASGQASHACNKKSSLFHNDVWTYDFIFDRLADGRALKILAVTDEYTRQSLALEAGISMNGSAVVSVLNKIAAEHGFPAHIRSDNGPEFIGRAVKQWLTGTATQGLYVEPGSPWQNGYAESLNSRFRDECLNMHIFYTLKEARAIISEWQRKYNERRPHSALGGLPPKVFAARLADMNGTALRYVPPIPFRILSVVALSITTLCYSGYKK